MCGVRAHSTSSVDNNNATMSTIQMQTQSMGRLNSKPILLIFHFSTLFSIYLLYVSLSPLFHLLCSFVFVRMMDFSISSIFGCVVLIRYILMILLVRMERWGDVVRWLSVYSNVLWFITLDWFQDRPPPPPPPLFSPLSSSLSKWYDDEREIRIRTNTVRWWRWYWWWWRWRMPPTVTPYACICTAISNVYIWYWMKCKNSSRKK